MKLRHKLFIAMASLVCFMAVSFFAISRGYLENLFQQYANAERQSNAEQWARMLSYYYRENSQSWLGVQYYVAGVLAQDPNPAQQIQSVTITDIQNNVVASVGRRETDNDDGQKIVLPLGLGGTPIGTMTIDDYGPRGPYEVQASVLHSMTVATVTGTVLTALVALLIGLWLSRRVTQPLRQISHAMQSITDGDLQTRIPVSSDDEFGQVSTTFNEMTERLAHTEEARKHLVADVAHELRTPLTIMQGQLELIQQGVRSAEPENLLPIQDEVTRLSRLVQDLHQLSLAEVGKLTLEVSPTAPVSFLERIVDNFQVEAEDVGVTLSFLTPNEDHMRRMPTILIDRYRMTQVFVNLIGNAIRYTPTGGHVTVRVDPTPSGVQYTVSDTGSGISPEDLPHIFDRFYRATKDRNRGSGGTGLGLAIAREYVLAHHGKIHVSSTVGEGTTFMVWLPTDAARASSQPQEQSLSRPYHP